MAVSQMSQVVLLVQRAYKHDLLKAIQSIENFEVIDETLQPMPFTSEIDVVEEIQHTQKAIDDVLKAQQILSEFIPSKLKNKRYHYSYHELEEKANQLDNAMIARVHELQKSYDIIEKQVSHNQETVNLLYQWRALPFLPKQLKNMHAIAGVYGKLPQSKEQEQLIKLNAHEQLTYQILFQNAIEIGVVVYCAKSYEKACLDFLETIQFSKFDYPYAQLPTDEIKQQQSVREQLLQQKKQMRLQLKQFAERYQDLIVLETYYQNKLARLKAEQLTVQSDNVFMLKGYIEQYQLTKLTAVLNNTLLADTYTMVVDTVDTVDVAQVPTVLNNHPLVEPFELLTEMYSLPKYNEIDPTPYMAPFYAVFFGMMVADIGYGLLMLLGTLYALNKLQLSKGMKKNVKLFHILAYPSILWGVFFGSFFSFELPFKLLSTATDVISILGLSVAFGMFQLIFGLALNTKEQIKSKNYFTAFSDGVGWIGILVGIILLVMSSMVSQYSTLLHDIATYVILMNVILIVLSTALGATNKLLGFGSGLYKLYGASSYIGDLASYTRLMALCVAGASIGSSFNLVISLLPPFARFSVGIILFIILQLLNLALALLGAYVHAIRLQFVEFFGKFYEGGGRQFKPLKTYDKYIDLKENKK